MTSCGKRAMIDGRAWARHTVAAAALCWIGPARVYTGVHNLGDILASALCGCVGGVFAVTLRPVVAPLPLMTFRLVERVYLA